ncbi:hypothetical protein RF55_6176 [Lasius niger]|uniref:Uncharacterized protein n=1 Tax=Lasius niger TaxID=67767 RepID=A0A0J7KTG5_LASNI|nr:hypothetical protein RF55_6176 [Lasius niger]
MPTETELKLGDVGLRVPNLSPINPVFQDTLKDLSDVIKKTNRSDLRGTPPSLSRLNRCLIHCRNFLLDCIQTIIFNPSGPGVLVHDATAFLIA